MAIVLILVLSFVFMEVFFFFGVLFVGLFGMIVASCMKANLTFGELYKLGIYTDHFFASEGRVFFPSHRDTPLSDCQLRDFPGISGRSYPEYGQLGFGEQSGGILF